MSYPKTIGYYMQDHEQGLCPPDSYVTAIKDEEWYQEFKAHFNNLLDIYYSERVILNISKYNNTSDTTNYNNLRHTIAYILLSRALEFSSLYYSRTVEFNPTWNVDGTTTTNRILNQTGTDTHAHSGSDSLADTGTDVTTGQATTYDTSFLDTDKDSTTYGKTETSTYNSSNTETKNLKDKEDITVKRTGNIGTTTTVYMLKEYEDWWKNFDIWKYITHEIVNQISYGIYD